MEKGRKRGRKPGEATGYRVVSVDMRGELQGLVGEIISEINMGLAHRDAFLSSDGQSLSAHLNRVDYTAFQALVRQTVESHAGTGREGLEEGDPPKAQTDLESGDSARHLFEDLLTRIDSVGSYGMKMGKRLYYGYNAERKVQGRKAKIQRRKALFYTNGNTFSHEDNPLPPEYTNTICCGDSLGVLASLPENCIDLVFTSPPYNFGMGYDTSEDGIDWEEYLSRLFAVLDGCVRSLRWGGRIIVNVQPLFSDYLPLHHLVSRHLMESHLIWKGEILWEKNNYNCKYTAWGSWKSPKSPYLKYTWEFLEVFAKGDLAKDGRREDIDISAEEFKSWVVAKWSIGPERAMKEWGHPAMFPEALAERVIKLFSYRGDVVLDPFNGAGTTTAVASRLGRRFLGIDISPEYCATARSRLTPPGAQGK